MYINNIPVQYALHEPLKNLSYEGNKTTYTAKELDLNYRASLEISRAGELQIVVPDLTQHHGTTELPRPIPRSSPRDVVARYQKIIKMYSYLSKGSAEHGDASPLSENSPQSYCSHDMSPAHSGGDASSANHSASSGGGVVFLQVKIAYEIPADNKRTPSGIVFRHRSSFADLFEATLSRGHKSAPDHGRHGGQDFVASARREAESVYTCSFSAGSLRDLDCVRCWLPCIDALDQRLVFDIGIKAPKHWRIACSGKRISTFLIPILPGRSSSSSSNLHGSDGVGGTRTSSEKKIARFFTPHRIPAANVGFYMGAAETYKMPLYRVKARIWVATGLQDFVSTAPAHIATTDSEAESSDVDVDWSDRGEDVWGDASNSAEDEPGAKPRHSDREEAFARFFGPCLPQGSVHGYGSEGEEEDCFPIRKLDDTYYLSLKRRLPVKQSTGTTNNNNSNFSSSTIKPAEEPVLGIEGGAADSASNHAADISDRSQLKGNDAREHMEDAPSDAPCSPAAKRRRLANGAAVPSANITSAPAVAAAVPVKSTAHRSSWSRSSTAGLVRERQNLRRLYADAVHHSTLGLDMALRVLHKFTGHGYDYGEFTLVFVPSLGCDFAAFDGFVLVDQQYLHTEQQVYLESAAHLLLLRAYLYSWLKSALPVSSYEAEFIVHGAVGYLLNFYSEEVFGEEEGRYRFCKMYETVTALERQGRGFPLASFFPESYEVFSPIFGEYLRCKSAVLFQLIENRVGGKDPMRMALKQLIRSPAVYRVPMPHSSGRSGGGAGTGSGTGSAMNSPVTPSMMSYSPYHQPGHVHYNQSHAHQMHQSQLYTNHHNDDSSSGGVSPVSPSLLGSNTPFTHMGGSTSPNTLGSMSPYYGGDVSPLGGTGTAGNMSPNGYNMSPYVYRNQHNANMSPYVNQAGQSAAYGSYEVDEAPATTKATGTGLGASDASAGYSSSKYDVDEAEPEGATDTGTGTGTSTESDALVAAGGDVATKETPAASNSAAVVTDTAPVTAVHAHAKGHLMGEPEQLHESVAAAESAGGYYATMARREARARSNSMSSDPGGLAIGVAVGEGVADNSTIPGTAEATLSPILPATAVQQHKHHHKLLQQHASPRDVSSHPLPPFAALPPLPQLRRQPSATSEPGWERDFAVLGSDCVSAEAFIQVVRHASGASADIDESFLEQYVYNSGVSFLRIHVYVSQKTDTRIPRRYIHVTSDQLGCSPAGTVDRRYCVLDKKLSLRIVESRDDIVTEPQVAFSDRTEQHQQQLFSRRGGRRRPRNSSVYARRGGAAGAELTAEQIEERIQREKEREIKKSALQKVRDADHPLRYY